MTSEGPLHIKMAVVGAGFGGLGMGVALKRSGEHDFRIFEKGHTVGGVWRDNTYPGCTCDVPSHLYSFSFAPYKSRDTRFPPQQNILAYLEQVAADWGLLPHLQLNTKVAEALYRDDTQNWEITTAAKQRVVADTVIFAVGQLHRPKYPNIPGLDTFTGPILHPAAWDINVDFHAKNVGIIGTGSSAAQMLPILASTAANVTIYQRTPHWVLPKLDSKFGRVARAALQLPGGHRVYRKVLHHGADLLLSPLPRSKTWRRLVEQYARRHLRRQVVDEELIKKLAPTYPIGSKRILFDNDFFPALTRSNVTLVTDPIEAISEKGIQTKSGNQIADILICATGFKASEFLVPMSVRGRDGRFLNDDWRSGAEAFMGLAVRGYPNLFLIAGPNSFNPAGSNPEMKELQIDYIMACVQWQKGSAQAIEVSEKAAAEYHEWLKNSLQKTVWQDSVDSWYKHGSGKVTSPWPESAHVFARMLRRPPAQSFEKLKNPGAQRYLEIPHAISHAKQWKFA